MKQTNEIFVERKYDNQKKNWKTTYTNIKSTNMNNQIDKYFLEYAKKGSNNTLK